jgi:hypothetical protein
MTGCEKNHERIDQVILGDLAQAGWQSLREHLKACEPCRERYNRAVLAERMLHGGPDAASQPSPAELDRVGQAVLGASVPERQPAWARLLQWFSPSHRWATGLAATAAIVALVPVLSRMGAPPSMPGSDKDARFKNGPIELFSSRGSSVHVDRNAGVRAFCLNQAAVMPLDPDPKGTAPPRCDRAGQLKLAVSNQGKFGRVFLVGMDGDHAIKWYAPRPPAEESVPAPTGNDTIDVPVGASVRLSVNHAPGRVRIFGLFSDRAVKVNEVEAAVGELARRGVKPEDAEALPLGRVDVLQRSLLIDLEP